jgi:beta-lactamase regulating signal transducer with metallopeptidase domain/WD40 repeat protein
MDHLDSVRWSLLAVLDVPLVETVIKSTIPLALAAVVCRSLGRQSAAIRHRVWVFGLAASLAVPLASLLLPRLAVPVLPGSGERSGSVAAREAGPAAIGDAARSVVPGPAGELMADSATGQTQGKRASTTAVPGDPAGTGQNSLEPAAAPAGRPGLERLLVLGWLTGTLIGVVLFLIVLARHAIERSRLPAIEDDEWQDSVALAARAIGLRRPIVALESPAACVPAVVGVFRPRLVIPGNWRTWSPGQRHCILLHELAHVKRCDVLAQLLGRLAFCAWWFNPLVWHAVRRLRTERELAADDCVLRAGPAASDYAEQLLQTLRSCQFARPALGVAMAHSARLDQRVVAILDSQRRRDPVSSRSAMCLGWLVIVLGAVVGGVTLTGPAASADPPADAQAAAPAPVANKDARPVWKENYAIEYPGTLPVSVAFSADGKTLLTGDTAGEVMALIFVDGEPLWRWKAKVDGSHAAVAFSADQQQVYATTKDGVRILDAARGQEQGRIEERDSSPTAIDVFPDKDIGENATWQRLVFGTPRGYFVETWVKGRLADNVSTLQTSTVKEGAQPADEAAVPLAVDPRGRSAIMTGPVDPTGEAGGIAGKNVLWAYVCGDYDEGSPGNRVMSGHEQTVVSAAWANSGRTAVTGDAAGRVIVWDATTMKETGRVELGGRIAALAISDDGARVAAYVLRGQGDVYVWETAQPGDALKPIHTELADFGDPQVYASLSFSPDGERLAGCAINKAWLSRLGELIGKVRVWELAAEPNAQLPPKRAYEQRLPAGSDAHLVIPHNHSMLAVSAKAGAIDLRDVTDAGIQARIVLGEFSIGQVKLATDRKWLALEQHPGARDAGTGAAGQTFDVAVYQPWPAHKGTISSCRRLLDIASQGIVAVVREQQIELWDAATAKNVQTAAFQTARIDAASFSPDGRLLALSDQNELVLWRWQENTHERIELGQTVGSLAFSPNGKFLAEGPTPGEDIQIRDLETRQVVQTLTNGARRPMNVPRLAWLQGGRVLIACDNLEIANDENVPVNESRPRLHLWDTADGSLAHQIVIPAGLPQTFDVSPNGRHLVAVVEDGDGLILSGWRLDGQDPPRETGARAPAATPR